MRSAILCGQNVTAKRRPFKLGTLYSVAFTYTNGTRTERVYILKRSARRAYDAVPTTGNVTSKGLHAVDLYL